MKRKTDHKEDMQPEDSHHIKDSLPVKKIPGENEFKNLRTEEKIKILELALKEFGDELDETERKLDSIKPQETEKRAKLQQTAKVLRDQISQIQIELKAQRWENAKSAWLSLLVLILIYLGLLIGGYIH